MEFARLISRIWYLFGGGWAGWSSLVLHNHGNCHLLCHILPWRNDVLDAGQRSSDGIPKEISGPRRWVCSWMDVLVSISCVSLTENIMLMLERFAYAILAADELVAVSNTIKFRYDDGRTFLNWQIGEDVDTAVWISVFLILAVTINMFPVKVCSASMDPLHFSDTQNRSLENWNTFLDV
jgi:hypothetical protein